MIFLIQFHVNYAFVTRNIALKSVRTNKIFKGDIKIEYLCFWRSEYGGKFEQYFFQSLHE